MLIFGSIIFVLLFSITSVYLHHCPFPEDHTLCRFSSINLTTCTNLSSRGLTYDEKNQVVQLHNKLRAKVANGLETGGVNCSGQPPASDMEEMLYDDDVAVAAQMWADQCTFGHDRDRRTAIYPWVGQNICMSWKSWDDNDTYWDDCIQSWYDEVKLFNPTDINPFTSGSSKGKQVGHYTQLAWATSNRLGCGYVSYWDNRFPQSPHARFYVCNYGPGGNIIQEAMYEIGPAASQCENCANKSVTYPGLCD